jgi:dipeptidyl aminopeptidase/acylaminoacyl peptidase
VKPLLAALLSVALHPALAAEGPSPPKPLSIEEVTARGEFWGLDLSPSGRHVAAIRSTETNSVVIVVDLDNPGGKPTTLSVPNASIRGVDWVSDDRMVLAARFYYGSREELVALDKLEDEAMGSVARSFAVDRDGGNFKMLFADNYEAMRSYNLARVVAHTRDRRHVIMPAWQHGRLDLFSVDIHSGESKRIAVGHSNTRRWFATSDGVPAFRLDINNDYGESASLYAPVQPVLAPGARIEWQLIQTIQMRTAERDAPPEFFPRLPGPEPNTYYVAARPDGADSTGIYLYDYVARKYVKTLATEPGIDIETVYTDTITRAFVGVQYYADRQVFRMADPKLQAYFDAAVRYFGEDVDVEVKAIDDAQNVWLLYTEGPRDAGSWHIYRLKDRFITEIGKWLDLDRARLGTSRVLRYKARDGLEIMGYLTVPPAHKAGDRPPLILMPHGGPETRDTRAFDPLVQLLATRGYQVFQPNFRGSSGFGRRFLERGHGQWGGTMQDDLTDAVAFLVKEGYAAKDSTCIVGFSYGGYAALAGATHTPELYRCAVSYAGISHLQTHLKHVKRMTSGDEMLWNYAKRMIGDPGPDGDRLTAHSPALLADAVKIPVLLIHGADDDVVHIAQSKYMEKALRWANKDVRFIELDDIGHQPEREDLPKVYAPILEFLERHLPPKATPPPAP